MYILEISTKRRFFDGQSTYSKKKKLALMEETAKYFEIFVFAYPVFTLVRQRETENVIMLRAKRETASQELEALVRQHDLWD